MLPSSRLDKKVVVRITGIVLALASFCALMPAQVVDPFYAGSYSITTLGLPPGVPGSFGGLTIKQGDNNTMLIGGAANTSAAKIYAEGLTRGTGNHITGFTGSSSFVSNANGIGGGGIDGGLSYGPGGILFYTSYADNSIGEIKPGSAAPDKQVALTPLGIASSVGALQFDGDPLGAGDLKIVSYNSSDWYDATLQVDGSGTYNITNVTHILNLGGGGPEGVLYVPAGSALFPVASILVTDYVLGEIFSYQVDANGDPILATKRLFISGLSGAEGANLDPLTNDFLFSSFGNNNTYRVSGFAQPPSGVPEPANVSIVLAGVMGLAGLVFRRRQA